MYTLEQFAKKKYFTSGQGGLKHLKLTPGSAPVHYVERDFTCFTFAHKLLHQLMRSEGDFANLAIIIVVLLNCNNLDMFMKMH